MKRITLVVGLLAGLLATSCIEKNRLPDEIKFETNFDEARAAAEKSDKDIIIDFYTDWCRWCDSLDANTYSDSLVRTLTSDIIFVKINAEEDTAIAQQFGVSGYPTVVIAKPNGEEIDRIWGYLPPTEFYNQVQLYLQGKETLEDYLSRLEDEPENLDYLMTIGEKYASRAADDKAIEFYNKVADLDQGNRRGYASRALAAIHDTQSRAGDYRAARQTCMKILRMYPDSPEADDAAALLGYYASKEGDTVEALKLYKGYLKMNPDSENAKWVKKRVADLEGE